MDTKTEYITPEKHQQLQEELNDLKVNQRKEVAEKLEYAKSLGDLSENAEYHEARDQQADIEDRIRIIEEILKNAVMISGNRGQIIEVGSKVKIKKQGGEETEYVIVGSEEADIAAGRISHQSPIGNALLGKKKGDQVVVTTPRGDMTYKIIDAK